MQILRNTIGLTVDGSLMRLHVARPRLEGRWPGILFYSDIYQLGDPIKRLADRLAGYGYVVAAPEIFHRLEPIGSVIEPDDIGACGATTMPAEPLYLITTQIPQPVSLGLLQIPGLIKGAWVPSASASAAISLSALR